MSGSRHRDYGYGQTFRHFVIATRSAEDATHGGKTMTASVVFTTSLCLFLASQVKNDKRSSSGSRLGSGMNPQYVVSGKTMCISL